MNYVDVSPSGDSCYLLSSTRTSLPAVSRLSLGVGIWAPPEPPSVDQELKYVFSSFTKIPALSLRAPGPKRIMKMAADPPNENALPLDSFRNLQCLECLDIDLRTLLGWDRLSESLWSLTIKRSGLDEISNYGSARRQATPSLDPPSLSQQSSFRTTRLPDSVAEHAEETVVTPTSEDPPRPSSPTESSVSPSYHDANNMIDFVQGIYQKFGQVLALNLSRNRLDSLCGLERLVALERVDVRHNQVEESGEVGRLSLSPNITEGNAFTEIEIDYCVKCFDFFWKEGKVDFSGWHTGRVLRAKEPDLPPPEQMNSTRPMSKAYSPPMVPVGGAATATTALALAPAVAPAPSTTAVAPAPTFLPAPSSHQQLPLLPVISANPRKKRAKRIVYLDAEPANANAAGTWITVSEEPSDHFGSPTSASRSPLAAPAPLPPAPEAPLAPLLLAEDSTTLKAPDVVPPKHRCSHTEYAPALALAARRRIAR
ncbi:hypothetical protein EDB85DRAFT_1890309 [Lactarius pseudohatsudake]|nr:hypothetical protein EDB85DRAFT_1890309 [Lactarius pseudohatsudake]